MAKKKSAELAAGKTPAEKPEDSLEQLSKLSREELLIKLGQLMTENAALRQKVRIAAERTHALRNMADAYLRQPFEDTMKDDEDYGPFQKNCISDFAVNA